MEQMCYVTNYLIQASLYAENSWEHIRKELSDVETLTEERLEAVIRRFLHDLKANALEGNGWP